MTEHTPTPWVVDTTVLHEIARGDHNTITAMQHYDATGQPMVVSVLAVTGALIQTRGDEAEELISGLIDFEHVMVAPLRDAEQAAGLANVSVATGLDVTEAHTAAIADTSVCPILTLDAKRWVEPSQLMPNRLHTVEIAEPDEPES